MVALILCFKYSDIAESQRKASSVMSPQAQVAQKLVSVMQCDSGQDTAGFHTTGRWHCWYLSSTASNRTRLYLYLGHHQKISSAAIFSPAPVHQSYRSTSIFSWDHKITCEENTTSAGCVLGHKGAVSQSTGRSVASVLPSSNMGSGNQRPVCIAVFSPSEPSTSKPQTTHKHCTCFLAPRRQLLLKKKILNKKNKCGH